MSFEIRELSEQPQRALLVGIGVPGDEKREREAVREFVRDCVEDYYALTTMARQWASDHGMDMCTDDGEVREEVIDGVVEAFDPVDIEGSAEAYDQPELMGPFWEYVGAPMVVTSHDGAVVLDVENVDAVMVADGAAEDFYVSWEEMDERVWSKQDFSGAMRRAREMELTRRVHELLLGRREEREAKAMVEAWDDWMERFKAVMAGKEGERSRLGRGMEAMARMVALLESTRAALPGRYRVGWLDVQLRWATWYAQMMESGEVKMSDVVKDDGLARKYEERFRKAVERKAELGVDEQGLKEFLADMIGKRMDAILVNVAAKSRRTLERFLKDRARERMDDMARRLYPKRERGKAWPRGKADAETYRFVQEAYKHMDAKPGEKGESGDYEAETQRLELMLEEETDEEKREELSEEVKMRRMFGEWGKMSYEQALAAEEYFTERVLSGRDAWAEKQQARREKIAYFSIHT